MGHGRSEQGRSKKRKLGQEDRDEQHESHGEGCDVELAVPQTARRSMLPRHGRDASTAPGGYSVSHFGEPGAAAEAHGSTKTSPGRRRTSSCRSGDR
jgi:hypothetical protein